MIGAASIVMDKLDSGLLSWLGVVEKTLADLNIHKSHKEDTTELRKHFNIGTFLLALIKYVFYLKEHIDGDVTTPF